MWLRFFCFVFSISLYSQEDIGLITVVESYSDTNCIYKFDTKGKILEFSRVKKSTNNSTIFKINYQDSLVKNITILKNLDSIYLIKYDFIYDKNRKLIAQKSSEDNDSIKIFYDTKERVKEIKNYYANDIQNIYLESNNIHKQISRATNKELSEYYDITIYTYETNKIIEEKTFYGSCGESKFINTKEFKNRNLIKETSFYPTNKLLPPVIIQYIYTEQGLIKNQISKAETKSYKITGQPLNIHTDVIKKINSVLIEGLKSIGFY